MSSCDLEMVIKDGESKETLVALAFCSLMRSLVVFY